MIVLAIETATHYCSVALVEDARVIAEKTEYAPQRHSELLLPFIDQIIKDAGLEPNQLDAVAVSIGPGSFTGLRIGLSAAKGISTGIGKPLIPVPTMSAAAFGLFSLYSESKSAVVVLPARKHEYYFSRFSNGNPVPLVILPVSVYTLEELINHLQHQDDMYAGEGLVRMCEELTPDHDIVSKLQKAIDDGNTVHYASAVGILARYYKPADVSSLEPLYIKQFESGSVKNPTH